MRYAERSIARGSRTGSPSTWSRTGSPARPTSSQSDSRPSRPGWGASSRLVAVASHRPQQAAHLGERRTARLLDPAERVRVVGEVVGELVPDGPDLEHHDADGVGDDVVELAGDSRPLLGDRQAGRRLALALGMGCPCFRRIGLLGPRVQREAGEPRDPEQERDEQHLARLVGGDVVDDRRRAAEHDHEAGARQHGIALVPEQERRHHAGEVDAEHERDQLPVDERERRPEQPECRRSAEGIAPAREQRSTATTIAGMQNHRVVSGASSASLPQHQLEHRREREKHDQDVEPVPAREVSEPVHGLNVLDAQAHRLLPE